MACAASATPNGWQGALSAIGGGLRTLGGRFARRRVAGSGLLLTLACSAGCSSDEPPADGLEKAVAILDANNYQSQGSLTIPNIETAAGVDLDICWEEVTQNLRCHDLDPLADLDNVSFLRLRLPQAEVEQKLVSGELRQSEIDGYLDHNADHQDACTTLTSFTLFGTEVDVLEQYVESTESTYMLLFSEGTTPGVGAQSMLFLTPSSASTNTTVAGQPGCGMLDFQADLATVEPVAIPPDGPFVVNWEGLGRDSLGNPVPFGSIDQLLIGFYEGKTLEEIEAQIFDLELIATTLWDLELEGGRSADLTAAVERGGSARFSGFDRDDGVWLMALLCSTCQNPAPILLTVLEPAGQP